MLVFFGKFVTRVRGCSTEGLEGPLAGASEDRLGSWAPAAGWRLDPPQPPPPGRNHELALPSASAEPADRQEVGPQRSVSGVHRLGRSPACR